ncbi:MAG TPA: hypothetical protein VGH80_11470 [Xanthomonadaceae bacterium]|jgi:hypothetical protein
MARSIARQRHPASRLRCLDAVAVRAGEAEFFPREDAAPSYQDRQGQPVDRRFPLSAARLSFHRRLRHTSWQEEEGAMS